MSRFETLCSLLPADVNWGDEITPDIVDQIIMKEREACLAAVRGVMVTDHAFNTWKRCIKSIERRSEQEQERIAK